MKHAVIIPIVALMMCTECFAKVETDKAFDNSFYVYSGSKCKAVCVIDETSMPYYKATGIKSKDIKKYESKAKKWLEKYSRKTHTYTITFKRKSGKKWVSEKGYTLKKKFKRKIKIKSKSNGNKSYVYGVVSYTGRDEKFYTTKAFKKNVIYVENSADNEAFYFDSKGKFHWEPGEDDDE